MDYHAIDWLMLSDEGGYKKDINMTMVGQLFEQYST